MIYLKFYILTLLVLLWTSRVFAVPVSRLSTEAESVRFSKKDVNHLGQITPSSTKQYFFYFGLDNDNYYRLDKKTEIKRSGNDFGQTHALTLGGSVKDILKNIEHGLGFETALYTRYLKTEFDSEGNALVTQEFREISTLNYTLVNSKSRRVYFRYLAGIGLINDKGPLAPLALWQQSGNSGKGGVHRMVGLDARLKDQPSGGRQGFGQLGWSVGKFIILDQYFPNWPKLLSWMNFTVESGLLARTVEEGNTFFGLLRWNIPLVKSEKIVKGKGFVDLNLQAKGNYYTYENAGGVTTTFGLQFNFPRGGFMINFSQNHGNQNPSFYKYIDQDPLLSSMLFLSF